jgi:outer membrane murein-binding lipoprotein Lpp
MTHLAETVETNGKITVPQIVITILLVCFSMGVAGLVGYFRGSEEEQQKRSDLAGDVRVLKEQVSQLSKQVDEMRVDIRALLARSR